MFSLANLLAPMLLPPGVFLLLLLAALIFLRRRKRGAGLSLLWILAVLLYLLSIRPFADSLIGPLETSRAGPIGAQTKCGSLVVFGGGALPPGPFGGGQPEPGGSSALWAYRAFAVWKKSPGEIILSGGSVYGEDWNSAQAMAALLDDLGVPRAFLILEQESRNTFENAKFTANLLTARGHSRPCLVTSAYHMPRAVRSMAAFGIAAIPVPADYKTYPGGYGWRHVLPSIEALSISAAALHEYLGMLFYMLAYGI